MAKIPGEFAEQFVSWKSTFRYGSQFSLEGNGFRGEIITKFIDIMVKEGKFAQLGTD